MANGAPTVSNGLVITGVTTSTTFSGSGASLTNLNASNIASGTVPTARLGSGTANSSTFLAGDSTFKTVTGTTINNNADNRIITGSGTANTLEGESTITYANPNLEINTDTSPYGCLILNGNSGGLVQFEDNEVAKWSIFGDSALNFYQNDQSASRLYINSDGNIGVGGITSPLWTSGGGIHLNDNYGIGFGNGGSGRPDFQLMVTDGTKLEFRCGYGADTADISMDTSGRLLIGTTSASISSSELFEVKSNATGFSHFRNNSSSYAPIYIDNEYSDTGFAPFLTFTDGGGNRGGIGQDNTDLLRITGQGGVSFYTNGTHGGGTERLKINQNGQVTKPAQASFAAMAAQNGYVLNGQVFPFNTTTHNIGSHFNTSNYRFTAPVAGRYLFTFYSILNSSGQGRYEILINGAAGQNGTRVHMTPNTTNWDHVSTSWILNLSANDYIQMYSNSNTGWHGNHWQRFCGELLS